MSLATQGIHIGPAGNSESFYAAGFKKTTETFAWQMERFGLDAFEIPFGRGIAMSLETAEAIGIAAREAGVSLSAHAPYYINLASKDEEQAGKSHAYILETARLLDAMGGERVVVHLGSPKAMARGDAMQHCARRLLQTRELLQDHGLGAIRICPETMGRPSVIGTLDEVLFLVGLDDSFLPCIDFAHLHALGGALNGPDGFARVLDRVEQVLGLERARLMHMHFSKIEYGAKGEIRHRVFSDSGFGPDFAHLAPLLVKRGYHGTLICESRGTMAEDAHQMKAMLVAAEGFPAETGLF